MANAEVKPEVKPEQPKDHVEETLEPLKYKTWVLKVSVHCEGCKRKVKKVLHSIEGVYTTDIDMKQQKVTVNGNIEAETLIKKLTKAGRHAELWPVNKDNKKQGGSKSKKKKKQQQQQQQQQSDPESGEEAETPRNNKEKETTLKSVQINEDSGKSCEIGGGGGAKQTVCFSAAAHSPGAAAEKPAHENVGGSGGGGGGGSKKKKKKGHKGNNPNASNNPSDEGEQPCDVPANAGSPRHVQGQGEAQGPMFYPGNYTAPSHHACQYPPPPQHYHAPPVHSVSYHTAYPSASCGGTSSYYHSPSPPSSYTYEYVDPGHELDRLGPSEFEPYLPRPATTFELFSDENPNACLVM